MERLPSQAELSYQPMANHAWSARAKPVRRARAPQTGRYTTSSNGTEPSLELTTLKPPACFVRFDHVACFIVNANHTIMRSAASLRGHARPLYGSPGLIGLNSLVSRWAGWRNLSRL